VTSCHSSKKEGRHGTSRLTGECLQCHDPHASDSSGLLKANSTGQCDACHTSIAGDKYQHSALEEYDCQECHNPHTSPPVKITACVNCHDDKSSGEYVHTAVDDGCDSCHTTGHDQAISDKSTRKDLRGVQCEACHGPGSLYKSMKVMKDPKLAREKGLWNVTREICLKCHR
jgi:predicted CXXCH cytochrome family protein